MNEFSSSMESSAFRTIVLEFVAKINAHDIDGLCGMMTQNHLFIDSVNTKVRGRDAMRKAWGVYFHMVPDFTIEISEVMVSGATVGLFGRATGTFSPDGTLEKRNRWQMPSAWRAVVHDNLVAEWQVYADNEPVRALLSRQPG